MKNPLSDCFALPLSHKLRITALWIFYAIVSACPLSTPIAAEEPMALIEEVTGSPRGVAAMQFVPLGTVIVLKPREGIVIDYFRSCTRETVIGGTVIVGTLSSEVSGGTATRETVQCDGGQFRLSADQASKSGVMVYRGGPSVQRVLYSLSPLIYVSSGGKLVIERLDHTDERLEFDLGTQQTAFCDFAAQEVRLVAGGVYRARTTEREIVFMIDPGARARPTPLLSRLLWI